jgi:ubiquinone/menaquinone biosynthesis C-methylase UbiE
MSSRDLLTPSDVLVKATFALREMARVLKPGGRVQIGDISVQKAVLRAAKDDIALWTC